MEPFSIHLLGTFQLRRGSRVLPPFPTQVSRSIFSYLVLQRGRMVPREVLAGKFWGERPEAVARKCLRTEVWRVRATLEAGGAGEFLVVRDHQVGFDTAEGYWLDVEEFERCIKAGKAAELENAVGLYRGDLLDGVYEEWCLAEQERLKLHFLRALERLVEHYAHSGDWDRAIEAAERLLSHDPLREHVHRHLMRFHYQRGDRPGALRQYRSCERLLRDELEIEPMRETRELYEALLAESLPAAASSIALPGGQRLETLLRAWRDLDQIREEIVWSVQQLEAVQPSRLEPRVPT